jgi:hypothetical protein
MPSLRHVGASLIAKFFTACRFHIFNILQHTADSFRRHRYVTPVCEEAWLKKRRTLSPMSAR